MAKNERNKVLTKNQRRKPIAAYWTPWGSIGDGSVNLTGSAHLFVVEYDDGSEYRTLTDCGIYQGPGSGEANRGAFPLEPSSIHLTLLTHGHADHCGRLPVFVKNGYPGEIWATALTAKVARASLTDAAKLALKQYESEQSAYAKKIADIKEALRIITESKAKGIKRASGGNRMAQTDQKKVSPAEAAVAQEFLDRTGIEKSSDIPKVMESKRPNEPLFLPEDAEKAITRFKAEGMGVWIPLPGAPGVSVMFFDACHVLGSTSVAFRVHGIGEGREKSKTFVLSGDIGPTREFQPHGTPVIPEGLHPDLIAVECTYGGRRHYDGKQGRPGSWGEVVSRLGDTVKDASRKRDILVLPAFALDRAQIVLHLLVTLKQQGAFEGEIYLDSPLSTIYTRMYQNYVPAYSKTLRSGPKTFKILEKNERESVLSKPGFKIVVTSSGMGTGGPVGEYFRKHLENSRAEFLFTGYMAEGTPGRALTEGEKIITIPEIGASFEVRAKIGRLDGLSSHADESMVREWCGVGNPAGSGKAKARFKDVRIALIHGETRTSIPAMKHAFGRRLFPEKQILTPLVGERVYL